MVVMAAHSAMAKMKGFVVVVVALTISLPAGATGGLYPVIVFGDSYGDVGNNGYLTTPFRADSPPYGIDSPTGRPTGRFSNDKNIADYIGRPDTCSIARAVGLPPGALLAYLDPRLTGERLLDGVVFASGGVGILNDTALFFENTISMTEQLQSLERYKLQLTAVAGGRDQAERLINKALFYITLGSTDFLDNFLLPFSARASRSTSQEFIDYLISEYKNYMRRLYEQGARRVLIVGVGSLGCLPALLAARSTSDGQCDPELQSAAVRFNDGLIKMGQQLNDEVGEVVFIVANTNKITSDFYSNAPAYGFTETRVACCGQGLYNGEGLCTPVSNLCPDRDVYVNWESIHLTNRANSIIAEYIVNGSPEIISPMNLNTMLNMNTAA